LVVINDLEHKISWLVGAEGARLLQD